MRILLAIWPRAPRRVLTHCALHDVGEMVSGDPPYPIKALNPDMKQAHDRVEREAHLLMSKDWMLPEPPTLIDPEQIIFKLAEFIEMWEWGLHELSMGNRLACPVIDRCLDGITRHVDTLRSRPECREIVERAADYVDRRVKQFDEMVSGRKGDDR
jgi:hypothetical protein